ncbi:glycoside hydrolase domain-containing protein [Paenibacillus arenilitoris]|uniref:S-layer homology domain-containing protein n=1 Tax=Paenibacillus arenilitoris TaxID=2772299 RepID=A0A927CGG4_9BACL|nr:glycoside hydrolase domain-containing protein [Paenibacillus arenilitoris]MBD2867105.1 S-layer homology domain-containing protein [Paenibacillus arenilitoris]
MNVNKTIVYLCAIMMIFGSMNVGYAANGDIPSASPENIARLATFVDADDKLSETPTFYYWEAQWSSNWYPFGVNATENEPSKIIDGDGSTYLISKKNVDFSSGPRYITLGWDRAQSFNTAVFSTKYAKARGIKEYNIETTKDGTNWKPAFDTNQTLEWDYFMDEDGSPVMERIKVDLDPQQNIIGARIAIYSAYTEAANGDYALYELELYQHDEHHVPPAFDSINDRTVPTGRKTTFSVTAVTYGNSEVTYSIAGDAPAWAAIDSVSGELAINNPSAQDVGTHIVTVQAVDSVTGAYSYQNIPITITEMANIAALASSIDSADKLTADYSMPIDYYQKQAGEPYWYPAGTSYINNSPDKLIDGDKSTLFVSKINTDMGGEPSGDSPHYITLNWAEPQQFNEIVFTADFGNQKSILNYNIEVTKDNNTWTKLFNETQKLNWTYSIYNFHDSPNPTNFTETIRVMLPEQRDVLGMRLVILTAPDANWGQAPGRSYWLNELELYNNPEFNKPVFTSAADKTFLKNTSVSFQTKATANGASVLYSLTDAPAGMTINENTGVIQWTTPEEAQEVNVLVRATNSLSPLSYTDQTISIHVTDSAVTDTWTVNALQPIYQADTIPSGADTDSFAFVMAKNEYESAQIAIRSSSDFSIYGLEFSDLASGDNIISSSQFKYGFPEYRVPENALPSEFNYIANTETTNLYPGSFVDQLPDPISNEQSIDVNANTTQPLFFTVYMPSGAASGMYTGNFTLQTSLGDYVFQISAEVVEITLPDVSEQDLTVYNWTAIYGHTREKTDFINQYYGAVKYSEDWWAIIENFARNLADYRNNMHMVKPMTFLSDHGMTLNHFTGDSVPVIAEEDWAEFDRYMQIFIDQGFTRFSLDHLVDKINMVVGDNEHWNKYDKDLIHADGSIDPGAFPVTDKFVTNYLTAIYSHLQEKGWLNQYKWYLHLFDEPSEARPGSLPWWSYVSKLSKNVAPEFKIGDAGLAYYYPELVDTYIPEMKDYYLAKDSFDSWANQDEHEGKEKWGYSLGHDTELNRLTNQPTLTSRLVFWDFNRNDLTGYLNWAWNAWWDGEYYGDTFAVYPDAKHKTVKSSLRYEAQRDGIEEYELLTMLKSRNPDLADEILNTAVTSRTQYTLDVDYIKALHDYLIRAAAGQSVGSIPQQTKPYREVVSGSELINNSDSRITYEGTGWATVNAPNQTYSGAVNTTKADGSYENDVSTTKVDGDSAELSFYGYGINVYVEKNRSMGKFDVYIDGELQSTVDAHEDVLYRFYPIYTNYSLSDGPHTIKIVNRENGANRNKDGTLKSFLVLDAFRVFSNTDPGKNTQLSGLSVTGGALNREFAPYVTDYSIELPNDAEQVTLTPAAMNMKAKIIVNGKKLKKDGKITVYPRIGKNRITITVDDKGTTRDYVFLITRLSNNMALTADVSADNAITPDYVQSRTGWNYGMGEHQAAERTPSKINDGDRSSFFITPIRYDFDGYIDDATSQPWGFVDGIEQRRFFTADGQPITYYISLHWDDPQTFDTLRFFTQNAAAWGIHRYNIETTPDGVTWEPVFDKPKYFSYTTFTATEKEQKDVYLPIQEDKLGVRIAITAASYWGSEAYALNELEIFFTSEVQPGIEVESDANTGSPSGSTGDDDDDTVETSNESGTIVAVELDPPILNPATGVAAATVSTDTISQAMAKAAIDPKTGVKTVELIVPVIEGAKTYELNLPADALSSGDSTKILKVSTAFGSIAAPASMLPATDVTDKQSVSLSIAKVDAARLGLELREQIKDRPVIELMLHINGTAAAWNNPEAPVTITIPYTPSAEELADNEHIVVWYVDSSGQPMPVPTGKYDSNTGSVTFRTTHFSQYAVAFAKKTFGDLSKFVWAKKEIEVLASKGIITGVSTDSFAPAETIKRADFVLLLVRALGLNAKSGDSFSDVSSTAYYADAVGIAKKLGIVTGIGDNRFNPNSSIARQEMMTMIDRAMTVAKKNMNAGHADDLVKFTDQADIASYAAQSIATLVKNGIVQGDGKRIDPFGYATRAETAMMIYAIYKR